MNLARIRNIGTEHPLNDWGGDDHIPGYWLPAPIALKHKPGEAGQKLRVRYTDGNMRRLVAMQRSRDVAKKLLRLRGGLFNEDGNGEYHNPADPTKSFIPLDGPWETEPIAQPIASILGYVNVLERSGAYSRIETLDPSKPLPAYIPEWLLVHFKSLQVGTNNVGNAIDDGGVTFPLFAVGEAWIPTEILEFGIELPKSGGTDMQGLGCYVWQIAYCFGGDIDRIIQFCKEIGITRLEVKHYDYTVNKIGLRNPQLPELSQACMENGIQLWVWEFNYQIPEGPEWNASKSAELAHAVNAYGVIANFEEDAGGYQGVGGRTGWMNSGDYATRYFAQMKKDFHGPLGGCSYRTPDYHLTMPWKQALSIVDYNIPQLYYEQEQNPKFHLDRALAQFAKYPPAQFIPLWPAYQNVGWVPTKESIKQCLTLTKDYGFPAASFWYFEWLHKHPEYVDVIREFNPWREGATTPPPPPPPSEEGVNIPVTVLANPILNIRSTPMVAPDNKVGTYPYNSKVIVTDIVREGRNLWGRTDRGWIALRHSGSALTDLCL